MVIGEYEIGVFKQAHAKDHCRGAEVVHGMVAVENESGYRERKRRRKS